MVGIILWAILILIIVTCACPGFLDRVNHYFGVCAGCVWPGRVDR